MMMTFSLVAALPFIVIGLAAAFLAVFLHNRR